MSYIHSDQFNHYGSRLYSLFRRASSTGHYDSTWIQYLQMSRRITRSRCCVRNYVQDTMNHGSAKPTGRPRILNDRDELSVVR
uniref:HTH_Tnp_Tc3_1 domain-containing protein n=1 Tax=Caenorhabditis japonica TaxID=281687 RepID=A0A8R1E5N7_CAEJA